MKALSLRWTCGPSYVHITAELQERFDDMCGFVRSSCVGVILSY